MTTTTIPRSMKIERRTNRKSGFRTMTVMPAGKNSTNVTFFEDVNNGPFTTVAIHGASVRSAHCHGNSLSFIVEDKNGVNTHVSLFGMTISDLVATLNEARVLA